MKTTMKSKETTGAANKGSKGTNAPQKVRAGVELEAGAQARAKAGVDKALQPVEEVRPAEPEFGEASPPVQPAPPVQPEPGKVVPPDAAETSGGTGPGEVALPVAVAPADAGEASAPAQPSSVESAEVPAVAVAPAAPAPAASGPVPSWRSSPARILRSALSPLDDQWYDWSKLEATIPGVLAARTLLRGAYEAATRLEKAAASGKPAKRRVEPGALVKVRAKHALVYAPLADVTGVLRVAALAGGQAKVETAHGESVLLPVAHLELAEVAA